MKTSVVLDGKKVGPGHPCYIIAEIGSNHNRDLATAKKLIKIAKDCGCDAVKFQSYTSEGLYSVFAPRISEMEGISKPSETPFELIKRIEMPVEWHPELKLYCEKTGISFCATPFDESMVDVLERIGAPFYKVASFEITHFPLLKKIASTRKPVIISAGHCGLADVENALNVLRNAGAKDVGILHCVSSYPARYDDMNLRSIQTLRQAFQCPVGLSDHTLDTLAAVASVALGMNIIEKHITLDQGYPGPDHPFALEPDALRRFVSDIRNAELSLGDGVKRMRDSEKGNKQIGRRSLVAKVPLRPGDVLTEDKICIKRPAMGISPMFMDIVIGKKIKRQVPQDHWISWEDLLDA